MGRVIVGGDADLVDDLASGRAVRASGPGPAQAKALVRHRLDRAEVRLVNGQIQIGVVYREGIRYTYIIDK